MLARVFWHHRDRRYSARTAGRRVWFLIPIIAANRAGPRDAKPTLGTRVSLKLTA
jgi:hypothetical protein